MAFKQDASTKDICKAWMIVGLAALFYSYEYFLRITPSVMSHQLMHAYHVQATGFGQLSAYYYYAYTPMQLFVGILLDRFGTRRLLTLATILCVMGALLFGCAHSLGVAAAGRLLIGFGSAFAFVGTMKLSAVWLPPSQFAISVGLVTSLGTLGAITGNLLLTQLTQLIGWQQTVYFSAILGIVLSIALWLVIRDAKGSHLRLKILPPVTLREVIGGVVHSLTLPSFWLAGMMGALLYLTLSAIAELWGNRYLMTVYHFSAEDASFAISTLFFGWMIGGPIVGYLSGYLKSRRIVVRTGALLGTIVSSLIVFYPHWPNSVLFLWLFLLGACASVEILSFAMGKELSDKRLAATAVSLINMIVMLSGVIFQPIIGILLDHHWSGQMMSNHLRLYSASDFRFAMSILPLSMLATFLLSFVIKETFQRPKKLKGV